MHICTIFVNSSCFPKRPQKLTKSSPSIWHLQLTVKISSNFMAFLENMNFKIFLPNIKLSQIAILCPNKTDSFFLLYFSLCFRQYPYIAKYICFAYAPACCDTFVLMVSKTFCFETSRLGVFIQIYLTVGMINDCKAKIKLCMYKAYMASNSSLHIVRVVTVF